MPKDRITIVILALVVILVGVGVYVLFFTDQDTVEHNYKYTNGQTVFDIKKLNPTETYITFFVGKEGEAYTIILRNDPLSLEDIPVYGTLHTRIFNDKVIYITIDPDAGLTGKTTLAALEIDKIIDNEKLYKIPVYSAMTKEYQSYPVKTCDDATDSSTVIYLGLSNETFVQTYNYCILITGKDEDDLIRAADRFDLTLLGIMQG